jgi:CheY-like chemotaxis protein
MDHEQLNVLVIDDDPSMRELLSEVIHRCEHQVVTAESAEEALQLLPYWTFQVAFLDQNLPGMEGLLLGEYLRKNNPDMMLALVTGDDDRRLQKKSKDLEIVYIIKPFDVDAIHTVLEGYVERARERDARRKGREDALFAPPIADYAADLRACYEIPSVPERLEGRLADTIKKSLLNLRTVGRYTERERVVALAGLLTARVLGVDLPRMGERSLYEEYDEVMRQHGRRTEFG